MRCGSHWGFALVSVIGALVCIMVATGTVPYFAQGRARPWPLGSLYIVNEDSNHL